MSMPKFPENQNITREEAVNNILASIAYEDLGLSHIINAEGEKIQYVLGTSETGSVLEEPPTIDELLEINRSVRETLEGTMYNQLFLKAKLQTALSTSTLIGPTGPAGPAPIVEYATVYLNSAQTLGEGDIIPFSSLYTSKDITFDTATGIVTLGTASYYKISYKVSTVNIEDEPGIFISVNGMDEQFIPVPGTGIVSFDTVIENASPNNTLVLRVSGGGFTTSAVDTSYLNVHALG